jgi:hypothetical protein
MTTTTPEFGWCRKVEGQQHDPVLIHPTQRPYCQPMRGWVVDMMSNAVAEGLDKTGQYAQRLQEGWECFHRERCSRCRKNLRLVLYKADCPQALPGAVVIADPPM